MKMNIFLVHLLLALSLEKFLLNMHVRKRLLLFVMALQVREMIRFVSNLQ